jgi:hypothetical protein
MPADGRPKIRTSLEINPLLWDRILAFKSEQGTSMRALVEAAVTALLDQHDLQRPKRKRREAR